jgi:hypothetical protein
MANPILIQKYLRGVDYPATKPEIIEKAKENGADKYSVDVLCRIAGQKFDNPNELKRAIALVKLAVK